MLQIWLECLEFAFEFLSNGSNLHSNASNPFRMGRICIVKVTLATRHNFHLSAFVFVFAGDGSPTHLRHVTDII